MSKIDDLINKLCPNGVKYYELGEIATFSQGIQVDVNKQFYEPFENSVPFLRIVDFVNDNEPPRYIERPNEKYIKQENEMIMIRYGASAVGKVFINKYGAIANNMFKIIFNINDIDIKYMYYYLSQQHIYNSLSSNAKSTMPSVNFGIVSKIKVAVPPLEVQDEIVHILDDFTLLSAELSAELKARQKQYEYYFDKILNNSEYPKMKLGDIGQVRMCRRILKSQTNNVKGIPFYKIGTFGKEPDAYIDEETFNEYREKYSYPKKGDILISCSGTIGRTVIFDGEPAYFQDSNIVWLEHDGTKVINEYLFYCYKTNPWSVSTGGTIARLYNENVLKAEISVPPIEEQQKIVDKLNRFYKICNDISEGLPAEIEARQKQYEYYRDKLLTFKELINEG